MSGTANGKYRSVNCKYLFYRLRSKNGKTKMVRLPIVHVYLKSKAADFDTIALVDSGSDRTLIPREQAGILALNYAKNKEGKILKNETVGAGGTFICNIGMLPQLVLMKNSSPFCTFRDIKVWVPENENVIPYAILGRDSIFKRFSVTFQENRHRILFNS